MAPSLASAAGRQISLALAALLYVTGSFAAVEISDLVQELTHLRDQSKDGVIHCDDAAIKRFGTGKQRPYALYVFLTARQVLDNPQLMMTPMREEYGLAAAAVRSGPDPDAAFFVEVVFEESPKIFQAVGANQVPYIFRIPGTRKVSLTEGGFAIPDTDKMTFQTMGGSGKYPWPAEVILSYFGRTGLVAGEVNRPSIYKSPLFPFLVLGALLSLLLLFVGLWRSGVLHHPLIYAMGAVAIFWFSVSGGMYNIIRGMPMFTRDKNGKLQFFLGSRSGQLGAEGFIVGSGYILFSACISLFTYAVPRVKNPNIRGTLSYLLVAATMYMSFQLFGVFTAKTGYKINSYLFR